MVIEAVTRNQVLQHDVVRNPHKRPIAVNLRQLDHACTRADSANRATATYLAYSPSTGCRTPLPNTKQYEGLYHDDDERCARRTGE